MIDIADLYQAAAKRFSCSYFKQDSIPKEETIKKILEESLKITPVFANNWHHRVDLYGPEYAEDKRKVCIQTIENDDLRDKYDVRRKGEPGIHKLHSLLDHFEEEIKSKKLVLGGFAALDTGATFNTQVMAPYLLKFSFHSGKFLGMPKSKDERQDTRQGEKTKGFQSSMAHAHSISIIANHYDVDASFCGCTIFSDENENRIWHNDYDFIFFMGLGYKHIGCYDSPGSKHYALKKRPKYSDIIDWK